MGKPLAILDRLRKAFRADNEWMGSVVAALVLLALTAVALGATLFSRDVVFSNVDRDLALQFIHWRKFGFDELRAGRLALWNPHIFCGAPFFGGFQSALLYPPNWLYLCLPLVVAINTGIALHIFLAGFGMFLWMRVRGLHPLAALFAGIIFMFSGPVFPHLYAGHLPNLCTMAWGPFVFLAIDGWLRDRTPGWLLLGAVIVALQILAGHPQYVFYTGVAAGLYAATELAVARERLRCLAGLLAFPLAGAALCAVQLLEGFHAATESIRGNGTSLAFAAKFRLPPENLVTALAPNFFGGLGTLHYWGRWQPWEMSVFFGVTGLLLAVYGLARGPRRRVSCGVGIACVLVVLAFGSATPVFYVLYRYAPGFGHFRGWSKFSYPAVLILCGVAATGYDVLLRHGVRSLRGGKIVLALGLGGGLVAVFESRAIATRTAGALAPWQYCIAHLSNGAERLRVAAAHLDDSDYVAAMARYAVHQLEWTALTLVLLGATLLVARRFPMVLVGLLGLASIEMLTYARSCLDRFPVRAVLSAPDARDLLDGASGRPRSHDADSPDLAMSTGDFDLWGYDPGVPRRYAEWVSASQGLNSDDALETMDFHHRPAVLASLLRLKGPLAGASDASDVASPPPALRLMLVSRARVIPGRDAELAAIFDPHFDPAGEVILETAPNPTPEGVAMVGAVRLLAETTDTLTIEAEVAAPAILLVTDSYSDGWSARSVPGTRGTRPQSRYQVLPADYCLRAIPLARGRHEILLEYRPAAFVVGKWISLVSLIIWLTGVLAWSCSWLPVHPRPPGASAA